MNKDIKKFTSAWVGMLWDAMTRTGNGYRRPKLTGVKDSNKERRPDKLKYSKAHRRIRAHA